MRSPVRIAVDRPVRPVRRRHRDRSGSTRWDIAGTSPGALTDATARIVAAAQAVLTTLDDAGRAKVQFPFEGPQKTRWSNLPSPMFQREGLRLGDLTPAQRAAVMTLLSTALSRDGYRKVTEIMRGDEVLRKGRRWQAGGRHGPGGGVRRAVAARADRRRPRWRRRQVRRGRVLPRLPRDAVGDRTVDAAVRRSSPGDQSDDGREPGDAWRRACPPRSRRPTRSKAGPSVRWATRTTKRLR